jgi:two-component system response regulator AtoC
MLERASRGSPGARRLGMDPVVEEMLVSYAWPGNVRELDNVLSRAHILADGDVIMPGDLPPEVARMPAAVAAPDGTLVAGKGTLRDQLRRMETEAILRALRQAGGDRKAAAQALGIGLSSLYRKLESIDEEKSPEAGRTQTS